MAALYDAVLAVGLELHHQGPGQNLQGRNRQHRISPKGVGASWVHSPQSAARQQGQIVDVQYVIYETPHPPDTGQLCDDELYTACPDTGTPDMDTPYLENRPQLMQLINRESTLKKKMLIHEARQNQALFNQASKLP